MSPASTQVTVEPGKSTSKAIQLINGGDNAYVINTSVAPYSVKSEEYDPSFTQLPGTVNVTSWIHLDKSSLPLEARKTAAITYTLTVPKNAAPGGYYAVIFAETQPIIDAGGSGVIPRNRVGNILYITVAGDIKTRGDASSDKLGKVLIQSSIPLGLKVKNTGGVHFTSTATITVKGITGKQLLNASLERFVLPQTERHISTSWTPVSPIGIYTIQKSVTVAGENKTLPEQKILFIQPWLLAVIFIVMIVGGASIVTASAVRRKKRSKKHAPTE